MRSNPMEFSGANPMEFSQSASPYDAVAHQAAMQNQSLIGQLIGNANPPDVVYNPEYYNTPNGQAELQQNATGQVEAQERDLRDQLTRNQQTIIDQSGQVMSADDRQAQASVLKDALQNLNLVKPLIHNDPNSARQIVAQTASDAINQQRNVQSASRDWQAIERGYTSNELNGQQVMQAAQQFESHYGTNANHVPGFLAFKGQLPQPVAPEQFVTLGNKLFNPQPGIDAQSQSQARADFLTATQQLSQPGVMNSNVESMQAQFVKMHPDFAQSVGVPQPMMPEQLADLANKHSLAAATEQAGGVPMTQDATGRVTPNEGWVAGQRFKLEAGALAHKTWIEQHASENDYLKSINPGTKTPTDPDELDEFKSRKSFYEGEARRILSGRMAAPAPQSNVQPPQPARDQDTVGRPAQPKAFNDGPTAYRAFQTGQVTSGEQVLIRGKRSTFNSQGQISGVQ